MQDVGMSSYVLAFPFLIADVTEDSRGCEMYLVFLPVYTVATALKAMCSYCVMVFDCRWNPNAHSVVQWVNSVAMR